MESLQLLPEGASTKRKDMNNLWNKTLNTDIGEKLFQAWDRWLKIKSFALYGKVRS